MQAKHAHDASLAKQAYHNDMTHHVNEIIRWNTKKRYICRYRYTANQVIGVYNENHTKRYEIQERGIPLRARNYKPKVCIETVESPRTRSIRQNSKNRP